MADDDDDYLLGGDDQVDYEGSDYDLDEEEEEEKDDAQENAEAAVGLPPDADGGADAPPAAEQGYRQTEVFKEEEIRPTIPARSVEELRQEPAQVRKHGFLTAQSTWTASPHVPGLLPLSPLPLDPCRRFLSQARDETRCRHAVVDPT